MQLEDLLARIFEEPANEFTDESSPENVLMWTSLRHVALLVEIENTYDVRFSNVEMTTMRNLGDIRTALKKKGVENI